MSTVIVVGLVAAAVIALAAIGLSESVRIRRALRKAPRVAIADFPDGGQAKIVGRIVLDGEPLRGPLSGRACAYYEATVEERRSTGKSSYWRNIIREVQARPFWVEDDSGRALVDPRHARVAVVVDAHSRSGTFDDATPVEESFLSRHGKDSTGWVFNKALRYREGALEAGEQVAVLGHGTLEPDPDAVAVARGYRDAPAMRVRIGGSPNTPVLISDHVDALGAGTRITD